MLLCPRSLDSYIRFDHMASFKLRRAGSHFADKLRSALSSGGSGAAASQDPQARLEEAVTAQFGTAAFEFATLVTFLGVKSEEVRPPRPRAREALRTSTPNRRSQPRGGF